jgi:hypothetical protein
MKKMILISLILGLVGITASYATPAGTLSTDWSVSSSAIGSVRAAAYNPTTGHMLLSINTGVAIIDGNNGAFLGLLSDPDGSIAIGSPMGICVDETGVIYMFSYYGSGYQYRWISESDPAPTITVPYPSGMSVPRGFRTYGSELNTIMYQAGGTGGDDAVINILTTSDGSTFTILESTEVNAAKTGVAVCNSGNTLYGFRPWGTNNEGVTKWDKLGGLWTKDMITFIADTTLVPDSAVGPITGWGVDGDVDPDPNYNVVYMLSYYNAVTTFENVTTWVSSNIVAINATSGAYIDKLAVNGADHVCLYYGGVGVDRVTHKIYWAARTNPSTSLCSNYGRMSYTIPLAISMDSITIGLGGNAILQAQFGTEPYSWSTSVPGIVSLSAGSGTQVTVTGIGAGTANVILTDSAAVSKICTFVVVPTSTEVWSEQNRVIIHKTQPLGELFE